MKLLSSLLQLAWALFLSSTLLIYVAGDEVSWAAELSTEGSLDAIEESESTPQQLLFCEVYLAPSLIPDAGRGVFAGRSLPRKTVLDHSVNIPVLDRDIADSQLDNYVFSTGIEGYSMLALGLGSLFNHNDTETVVHNWMDDEVADPARVASQPQSTFSRSIFSLGTESVPGQELFISYGDDWLEGRGLNNSQLPGASTLCREEQWLQARGRCLTEVVAQPSTLPHGGVGLFARRDFEPGEVVAVSPVLVMSMEVLSKTKLSSVLWNYCIGQPSRFPIALLPIARAALINHHSELANVMMEWDGEPPTASVEQLLAAPFAPLTLAYRATRLIRHGEEILLDYGSAWIETWQRWNRCNSLAGEDDLGLGNDHHHLHCSDPIFREMILPPKDLFPMQWEPHLHDSL
eukprot:gene11088-12351_t